EAIEHAGRAGVDSVEHGSFAGGQASAEMKAHGTYQPPTLTVYAVSYEAALHRPDLGTPGRAAQEKSDDRIPTRTRPTAPKAGVKVAYGTDIGEGDHAREFVLMAKAGMAPMEEILAATRNAADLIGASDRIGSVQAGRFADLVAVAGDPLKDPGELGKV